MAQQQNDDNKQDEKKQDKIACAGTDYPKKLDWVSAYLFPRQTYAKLYAREVGQFNIIQVFKTNDNNRGVDSLGSYNQWECNNERTVCIKNDHTAIATYAPKKAPPDAHSEALVTKWIPKIKTTHDNTLDFVVISTNEPCEICFKSGHLQRMCNDDEYNSCTYFWSRRYENRFENWDGILEDEQWKVHECAEKPESNFYAQNEGDVLDHYYEQMMEKGLMHKEKQQWRVKQHNRRQQQRAVRQNDQKQQEHAKRAAVEYFDAQDDDTTVNSDETALESLLYGDVNHYYGHHAQMLPSMYGENDGYILIAVVLFGIFAMCIFITICSYILGIITGVIGKTVVKDYRRVEYPDDTDSKV